MRFVLALLILLFSFSANASTTVFFLNGIDGYDKKNMVSAEKIASVLIEHNVITPPEPIVFGYWSNPGDGFFDDKLELMTQSLVSAAALTKAKFLYSGSKAIGSPEYKNELGKVYKDSIESGFAEREEDRHVYSVVKRLSGFLIEKFKAGDSFVVVSHSQGNFFAEAVDAYIRVLIDPSEISKYERNVKYVGFASVAGSTPNNRYISANEDIALDAHFLATAPILNFSMLPRNFNICKYLYIKCYWPLNGADLWTKHGFQEIYTSDLPDSENKTTLSREMASLIKASLDELRKSSSDFVENFNGSTLDSSKWSALPLGYQPGNIASFSVSGGSLHISTNGGSNGYLGIADGGRIRPKGVVLDGDFTIVADITEIMRGYNGFANRSCAMLWMHDAAADVNSTSSQKAMVSICGDSTNGGVADRSILGWSGDAVAFQDPLVAGKYYQVEMRIRRAAGKIYLGYRMAGSSTWKEVASTGTPVAMSLVPEILVWSGDGGGTRVNGSFAADINSVLITAP